jgi:hypothetical protein
MNFRSNEDCSSISVVNTVKNSEQLQPVMYCWGGGFESIIPYQDSNQNQCLSTREVYRACPINLTAPDTQFTTYK